MCILSNTVCFVVARQLINNVIISQQLETEGLQQQIIAGRIYDYIVDFWISPYVVIDNILLESQPGLKPYPFSM